MLDKGHPGLHDSHYCQWEEFRDKAEGDRIMRERGPKLGMSEEVMDFFEDTT